ncbi:MAG: transcriptional regulator [Acidimicrobiia bacterium]|jgi:predicted transcriptional regulator|nr:transcriptional regulator [Acidimicrobiia bacterium]
MKNPKESTSLRFGARRLGDLQHDVMETLWSDEEWLTPRQVSERVSGDRAYTTIMTVLRRLAEQGILERRRRGRAFEYRAVLTHDDFYADRLANVLGDSENAELTLARFVDQLTPAQRREIANRLATDEADGGRHGA